jgi:arginyl-tRNA synthetase
MIKKQLETDLKQAIEGIGYDATDLVLSISNQENFGDYSTNIPLQLAKQNTGSNKQSPQEIASSILEKLGQPDYLERAEVVGPGFLNFFVKTEHIVADVAEIIKQESTYGTSQVGQGQKVQVEFISANPTGPLTLANGRGGALGDALVNVLQAQGYTVEREFYVNDTGNQVRTLGESVKARAGLMEPQDYHYQGEYVTDLVEISRTNNWLDLETLELGQNLADYMLEQDIKPAIKRYGVEFDQYFSERTLHTNESIEYVLSKLREHEAIYEKDGAIWFKSTEFGDDQDRVLVTSEEKRGRSEPTYFLIDIAYHLNIFDSRGIDKKINFLGADHHGYEARMQAAMKALGFEGKLKIIFMQMVKLFKEGVEVRMSKRAGNFVTLDELLAQVSPDVAKFFFLMYGADSHINFDLDLAREQSNKNPVYYVQYAHARMANILSNAAQKGVKMESDGVDLTLLSTLHEKNLVRFLGEFPQILTNIALTYQVNHLTTYAISLADHFHKFYESSRVIDAESEELVRARLELVKATQIVLSQTLNLLGISAPEKM